MSLRHDLYENLVGLDRFVIVTVIEINGSAPREVGARMIVTGRVFARQHRRRKPGVSGDSKRASDACPASGVYSKNGVFRIGHYAEAVLWGRGTVDV